jgi:hypothetical protein
MTDYIAQAAKEINEVEERLRILASEAIKNNQFEVATKLFPMIESLVQLQTNESEIGGSGTRLASKKLNAKKDKVTYPLFSKLGNYLNRTGWSKKYKKEYNQRIDFKYVDLVVSKVLDLAKRKEAFEMTDLIPTVKEKGGKKVKDYLTYFVISWLKNLGIVEHHGDYGYCLGTDDDVRAIIKIEWENLPKKSGQIKLK